MLSKSIKTILVLCLIAILCLSFSNVNAKNMAGKAKWCSYVIHVYAYGTGCSSPQSGAIVYITHTDGSKEKGTTDSNGNVAFGCWGTGIDVTVIYGNHHGYACGISGNDGTITNICLNDTPC